MKKYNVILLLIDGALVPKLTSLKPITGYFQNENYVYDSDPPPETLSTGMEEKISKELKKLGYILGSNVVTIQCNYYHD